MYADSLNTDFFGAKAAGALFFSFVTKRILVGKRSAYVREPHTWGTIGGTMDDGEYPCDTVLREAKEEIGFFGDVHLDQMMTFNGEKGGKVVFQYYNFLAAVWDEFDPILTIPNMYGNLELEDAKWLTLPELLVLKPKHPGLKSLLADTASIDKIETYINSY